MSPYLEIGIVRRTDQASQYPGVFLFTSIGRMVRPVINLQAKGVEFIGSFEQVYMDIAVKKDEAYQDSDGKLVSFSDVFPS